jgi:hypothetical protein
LFHDSPNYLAYNGSSVLEELGLPGTRCFLYGGSSRLVEELEKFFSCFGLLVVNGVCRGLGRFL